MSQSIESFPLFPLGLVLLPGELVPLHIFEERYKLMIGECLEQESEFGIIWLSDDGLKEVGCSARITRVLERFDDGRLNILVEGTDPFRLARRIGRRTLLRRGLVVEVRAPAGAQVSAVLDTADLLRSASLDGTAERPRTVVLARRRFSALDRARRPRLRLGPSARRRLRRRRRGLTVRLLVTARLPDGRRLSTVRRIRVLG